MNNGRDRYGLPQVRNAWGTPPPPVQRVGTAYSQAYRTALPSVGRVRAGYSHAFSPAPAPVARVQTGSRVRPPTAGSVARFRRMIANPGPNQWDLTRVCEKEADQMELWLEDYKEKMLRIEIEQQQKERHMFNRLYMQDIPIFQQNTELKAANNALMLKMQQKDDLKSESEALKENAELKSENDKLKLKIEEIRQSVENDFQCPISTCRFVDPVVAQDGHTYEADCIKDWFKRGNHTSPLTTNILKSPNLVRNHTLKKVMRAFQ